jgi:hypothetical protein
MSEEGAATHQQVLHRSALSFLLGNFKGVSKVFRAMQRYSNAGQCFLGSNEC